MKLLFKGLIGVSMLTGVTAQVYADSHNSCDSGNKAQAELDRCLIDVEKDVDAAQKAAFDKIVAAAKKLDDVTAPRRDVVPALTLGQDAWTQYRDKHCEFIGTTWGGGSGTGIAITRCRIDLTRARIKELSQIEM